MIDLLSSQVSNYVLMMKANFFHILIFINSYLHKVPESFQFGDLHQLMYDLNRWNYKLECNPEV